jgi:hypothetical protein
VDDVVLRLALLLRLVLPFVFFMAAFYLALHIVVAQLVSGSGRLLWFFGVVTGPLTRPVRALLPHAPDARVRVIALGLYVALWLATRAITARAVGPGAG